MNAIGVSFTGGSTAQLFDRIPQRSTIKFFCSSGDLTDLPATNGILEVIKGGSDSNFRYIIFHAVDGTLWHYKYHSITTALNGWNRIFQNADIQYGTIMVNATANGTTEFTVNFSEIFVKTPVVIMSVATSRPDLRSVSPLSRDTKKVTGVLYNGTSAAELPVLWIAIAK